MLSGCFIKSIDGGVTLSKSVMDDLDEFDKQSRGPSAAIRSATILAAEGGTRRGAGRTEPGPTSSQYLLFFGFIRDYKGLDLLLDAFADDRIRQMKGGSCWWLAGLWRPAEML